MARQSGIRLPAGPGFLRHDLADCGEHAPEAPVAGTLELVEPPGQCGVAGDHFPESDERPHYLDVHVHRTVAAKDAGEHRDSLLGERIGFRPASAPLT
jgi:hypothetical protein